jgi:hypothetical protein
MSWSAYLQPFLYDVAITPQQVGVITQVFVKPKVVVVELHRPVAYGDLIMFRRVKRDGFEGGRTCVLFSLLSFLYDPLC